MIDILAGIQEEDLQKMAMGNIPTFTGQKDLGPQAGTSKSTRFDYSSVLGGDHQKNGYSLHINHDETSTGHELAGTIFHNGQPVGRASGMVGQVKGQPHLMMEMSDVDDDHQGKGLGRAMYEALFAHANRHGGAVGVIGGPHSSMASGLHQRLAQRHGWEYSATPAVGSSFYPTQEAWDARAPGPHDAKFSAYSYLFKSEEDLQKMALADLPRGTPPPMNNPGAGWDYSHLLPEEFRNSMKLRVHLRSRSDDLGGRNLYVARLSDMNDSYLGDVEFYHHVPQYSINITWGALHQGERHAGLKGRGLGRALYEAALAHGKNELGAVAVTGSTHSSMASRVHQSLSRKHGMDYKPTLNHNVHVPDDIAGPFDDKMANYEYTLKDEMDPLGLAKAEQDDPLALVARTDTITDNDREGARRMLGGHAAHPAIQAVRFMTGMSPDENKYRSHLILFDGDHHRAALASSGMPVTNQTLTTLRAIMQGHNQSLVKAESRPSVVLPGTSRDDSVAKTIQAAFSTGLVDHVNLEGRHVKNAQVAKDPYTEETYLIKYVSGGVSPARGVAEETATGPRREAGFYAIAEHAGLEQFYPECRLVLIDGFDAAAIRVIVGATPFDEVLQNDPGAAIKMLEPYRSNGVLHKWAALDFICGNPDSHANNMLLSNGNVYLIDHGSSFAGHSFDPAHDPNSFVPFFLRAWNHGDFKRAAPHNRLRFMPTVSEETEKALAAWVKSINQGAVTNILTDLQIDPGPTVERLVVLKHAPKPSEFLNQFFAGC